MGYLFPPKIVALYPPQQCPWLRAFPELGRAPGDHKGPFSLPLTGQHACEFSSLPFCEGMSH